MARRCPGAAAMAPRPGRGTAVALGDASAAVGRDKQDGVRGLEAGVAPAVHPRRANRHAGHRKADGLRPLAEQPPDLTRRHMPLDRIAADQRRVAGAVPGVDAQPRPHRGIAAVVGPHLEAGAFITPGGSGASASPAAVPARAASGTTPGTAPASIQSCRRTPRASSRQQRQRPANAVSWMRSGCSPSTRIDTSPSPSTWPTMSSTGAGRPRRSTRGPSSPEAKSHARRLRSRPASSSVAASSVPGGACCGTGGISKVCISRGSGITSSAAPSSGCEPGPSSGAARTGIGNGFIGTPRRPRPRPPGPARQR